MLTIQYVLPSPLVEAAQPSLSEKESEPPRRRRLRLYLVGSKDDVQHTVDHLHLRGSSIAPNGATTSKCLKAASSSVRIPAMC